MVLSARVVLLCLGLTACGRIGFSSDDPTVLDANGGIDGKGAEDPSLLVWFPMDEAPVGGLLKNAGTADLVARCHTSCPTVVAGKIGGAFAFDGVGAALLTSLANTSSSFSSATLALWSRFDKVPTSAMMLLAKPFGTGVQNSWELVQQPAEGPDGPTLLAGGDSVGSAYFTVTHPSTIGAWTHLAFAWDGGTGRVNLYVDGSPSGTTTFKPAVDDNDLYIGADLDDGQVTHLLRGELDDVRIYGRALSAAEIKQLAKMP